VNPDPIKELPWPLIIFLLISGFIFRRIGKFVAWMLVWLWPNEMNISLQVGVDQDMVVAGLTGGIALALVLGTVSLGFRMDHWADEQYTFGEFLRIVAEDYFALLFAGFVIGMGGALVRLSLFGPAEAKESVTSPKTEPIAKVLNEDRTQVHIELIRILKSPSQRLVEVIKRNRSQ
jgi:hypothetical protein